MSITVTLEKAASDLAALVDRAAAGEEIIIEAAGRPQAKLVAAEAAPEHVTLAEGERVGRFRLGLLRGQIRVGDDFEDPLPEDIMRYFRGEGD